MPDHTNPHQEGGEKSLPGDNRPEASTTEEKKAAFKKPETGNDIIDCGPCRLPMPDPVLLPPRNQAPPKGFHIVKILNKPRPGDSVHRIDYRSLFNLLYFKIFIETKDGLEWKPVKCDPRDHRLAPPTDYVCPYCNELAHTAISGVLRCIHCGRAVRPTPLRAYGKHAVEFIENKKRERKFDEFLNDCKRRS